MTRYDRRVRILAACLAAVAGYVDAIGFIELGGFFVSFMSGNSTRLGVGLADVQSHAAIAGGLIAAFVTGVVLGSLAGHFAGERRAPAVLLLVAALLAGAALLGASGLNVAAVGLIALGMGAVNATFTRDGEVSIGVTYMTGTLVKLGQRLTGALLGGDRLGWAPYLLLWMGLAGGAALGAWVWPRLGLSGLWLAVAAMLLLTLSAAKITVPSR